MKTRYNKFFNMLLLEDASLQRNIIALSNRIDYGYFWRWIALICPLLFLTACLDKISLDDIAKKRLVVEAKVVAGERAAVKISETVSRTGPDVFPGIKGAEVRLSDDSGYSELLSDQEDGSYRSVDTVGEPGARYFLEITYEEQTITGDAEMPGWVIPVDTIWYKEVSDTAGFFQETLVTYRFSTPPGAISQGMVKLYIDGEQTGEVRFFENAGTVNEYEVGINKILGLGQEIMVEAVLLEPNVYSYLQTVYDRSDLSDLTISPVAPPSNPIANLEGEVLGYFGAMTVGRKIVVVE